MIAEVVPKASDLATKGDIAEMRAEMSQRFTEMQADLDRRFAESDRRLFRYAMVIVGPMWLAIAAGLVRLVLKI